MTPATPATPAPPPQSEISKLLGVIYTLGIGAVAIFVKNPNHLTTATSIVTILEDLLPSLEALL